MANSPGQLLAAGRLEEASQLELELEELEELDTSLPRQPVLTGHSGTLEGVRASRKWKSVVGLRQARSWLVMVMVMVMVMVTVMPGSAR